MGSPRPGVQMLLPTVAQEYVLADEKIGQDSDDQFQAWTTAMGLVRTASNDTCLIDADPRQCLFAEVD